MAGPATAASGAAASPAGPAAIWPWGKASLAGIHHDRAPQLLAARPLALSWPGEIAATHRPSW